MNRKGSKRKVKEEEEEMGSKKEEEEMGSKEEEEEEMGSNCMYWLVD